MASEGSEMPIDRYIHFQENINRWYEEMTSHNLTKKEQEILKSYLNNNFGVADSQELAMLLVMDKNISGFALSEADALRKGIAKKKPEIIEEQKEKFYKKGKELGTSVNMLDYVWNNELKPQFGYSFSSIHTYGYSVVALVELNIFYKYPPIFWNTACLIVDSAGVEEEKDEDFDIFEKKKVETEELSDDEEDEEEPEEGEEKTKVKKKTKPMNYGKVSVAISKIQNRGIDVQPPNINKSKYTFTPDVENNQIIFGIKGITRISNDLVKMIIINRPYDSMEDFLNKVKVTKIQMINLIKSGAFDSLEKKERQEIMREYIDKICDKKKRLTLQNMQMLINLELIPSDYDFYRRLFNFNKYLKKFKYDIYYRLDEKSMNFLSKNYGEDDIEWVESNAVIEQKLWDKIYKKDMEPMRNFLKGNEEMLNKLNSRLFKDEWDKYCGGSISKWEMESISFYCHEHELISVDEEKYNIHNFFKEPEEGKIIGINQWKNRSYPIYETYRIAGTILNRDKNKYIVTILTKDGVVPVKVYQAQFTKYDKQISVKLPTGKKKVVEGSWFKRGNKILVTGFRRGDNFVPKIYKNGPYSEPFCLIESVNNGELSLITERAEVE